MNAIEIHFNSTNDTIAQLRERLSILLQFPNERIVISHHGNILNDETEDLKNIETLPSPFWVKITIPYLFWMF
jgi:hypothetical protein